MNSPLSDSILLGVSVLILIYLIYTLIRAEDL